MNRFIRTVSLIGEDKFNALKGKNILIVGLGGVGGYVFESLIRSGIEKFTLVDGDTVNVTNINRQIIALSSTVGKSKVDSAKERGLDINPDANITVINTMINESNMNDILSVNFDYCIDCFDSVKDKINFIIECNNKKLPLISAMGAGNRTNPEFEVTDIFKTNYDPLAKKIRQELRNSGVKNLKVVCDKLPPEQITAKTISSISFAPAAMGIMIGGEVIRDLISIKN